MKKVYHCDQCGTQLATGSPPAPWWIGQKKGTKFCSIECKNLYENDNKTEQFKTIAKSDQTILLNVVKLRELIRDSVRIVIKLDTIEVGDFRFWGEEMEILRELIEQEVKKVTRVGFGTFC